MPFQLAYLRDMGNIRSGWPGNPGDLCYAVLRENRHIPQEGRVGDNALRRHDRQCVQVGFRLGAIRPDRVYIYGLRYY